MGEFTFLGTGFGFPVEADRATGRLEEASGETDIRQSIHIILMTKKGERPVNPEFGCGIWDYVFGATDFSSLSRMEKAVEEALILWEPRIRDVAVSAELGPDLERQVVLTIRYVVRATNNPYNLVYPFYLDEGFIGRNER